MKMSPSWLPPPDVSTVTGGGAVGAAPAGPAPARTAPARTGAIARPGRPTAPSADRGRHRGRLAPGRVAESLCTLPLPLVTLPSVTSAEDKCQQFKSG